MFMLLLFVPLYSCVLVISYSCGDGGVYVCVLQAAYWWSRAAAGGLADAANNLGTACWNGEVSPSLPP